MRVVVADACSLILMTKCAVLRPYGSVVRLFVAPRVLEEAASLELRRRHADAELIGRAADEGVLQITRVRSRRKLPIALGPGEADTLRLFLQERADLLLSDDGRALRACRLLDIPFTTTPRVIVDLHRARRLERADARRALTKLALVGRYSETVVAAALNALEES